MTAATLITLVFALVIGGVFGNASATMTKPMSDSFRLFGPIWSAAAGLVVALVGVVFGLSAWAFVCCGVTGLLVGCAAVEFERWRHG
jgi:hypothetical protein